MYYKIVKNIDSYSISYNLIDYGDPNLPKVRKRFNFRECDSSNQYINESISRTRSAIRDYGRNNEWRYFFTATFDPKVYRSSDIDEVKRLVRNFCLKLWKLGYKYLIVPEYHSDLHKLHIHGLLIGEGLKLVDSGLKTCSGRSIYNVPDWKYGFTTLVEIDDLKPVVSYICKYISKDMVSFFNRQRYWCSKGLSKGIRLYSEYVSNFEPNNEVTNYFGFLDYTFRSDYLVVREIPFDILPDWVVDNDSDPMVQLMLLGREFESL